MGLNNRMKEIKRRRHRRKAYAHLQKRLVKASNSEKVEIVRKLREMTPGANVLIANWQLEEAAR